MGHHYYVPHLDFPRMSWKEFLDPDFTNPAVAYTTREYVITRCSHCGTNSRVQITNLKKQIAQKGTHYCWGCSISLGKLGSQRRAYQARILKHFSRFNITPVMELSDFLEVVKAKELYEFYCESCGGEVVERRMREVLRAQRGIRCKNCRRFKPLCT